MTSPRCLVGLAALALLACREAPRPSERKAVEPPMGSFESIPDAPVSGRLHGAPFTLRDARYVVDRRVGYAHTDILLSAGAAESGCAPVSPAQSTSVWLRLEGAAKLEATQARVGPGKPASWSVHYQVWNGEAWEGAGDGSALVSMFEPGPDGKLSGRLAVCFPDEAKSCVSGSFEAVSCPATIDQAVRGTPPPEAIPAQYLQRVKSAASATAH